MFRLIIFNYRIQTGKIKSIKEYTDVIKKKNSPERPQGRFQGACTYEGNNKFPECPWGTNLGDRNGPEAPSQIPGTLLATCQKKLS